MINIRPNIMKALGTNKRSSRLRHTHTSIPFAGFEVPPYVHMGQVWQKSGIHKYLAKLVLLSPIISKTSYIGH